MSAALRRAAAAIEGFAFTPARAEPLAALRIGVACILLAQAASIAPVYFELYRRAGVIDERLREAFAAPGLPALGWLVALLGRSRAVETPILVSVGALYLLSLVALCLGLFTRWAALAAWFLHLSLAVAAGGTDYGADQFAHLSLFYLAVVPSGEALSLDRWFGRVRGAPSWRARLGLRVIQLHLAAAYLAAGVAKAMGGQWWNGEAIWRASMLPEYGRIDFSWLAAAPLLPTALGWAVLIVEIGYPVLIWPRITRRAWVAAVIAMHAGIAVFLGLHIFGAMMAWLTFTAFAVSAEPARRSRVTRDRRRAMAS